MKNVIGVIFADSHYANLKELTAVRPLAALPVNGRYRIIDFVINNFINSGFYKIKILTQYKSDSLNQHIARSWPVSPILGQYIDLVPAQMRTDGNWYKGTADAVYQNLAHIKDENPKYVCVFGGDHIYRMDVSQMMRFHKQKEAALTISAIPIPISEASEFGIIEVDDEWRLTGFVEKPQTAPKCIPGHPDLCLASMGNYIFEAEELMNEVIEDAKNENSSHDFGKNIIPKMLADGKPVYVYDYSQNEFTGMTPEERGHWRDVGSIDSYWQANMDLLDYKPVLNLYSTEWPLRTYNNNLPPAKFIWEEGDRVGMATNSMVSEGCIISGGSISRCVLSPQVRINSFSNVTDSILMENVNVGRYCEIRKAIIDKNVDIPPYTKIGVDAEEDKRRGFLVSAGGVTVVPKGAKL